MRIAVLIIGLLLGLLMFMQSFTIMALGGAIGSDDPSGALGVMVAVLWLIGCGFVIGFPRTSTILFVVAAVLAIATGANTDYSDMTMWGFVSIGLAVMSFFGWRGKKRDEAERRDEKARQEARDAQLASMLSQRMVE